jgi:hypothetical protein
MLISRNRRHSETHFFKYMKMATLRIVLATRALRWSSPLLFNDPFDYARKLAFGFSTEEFADALVNELERMLREQITPKGQIEPLISQLLARITDSGKNTDAALNDLRAAWRGKSLTELPSFKTMQAAWDLYLPFMRILSLSEVNDSEPMWAHYAEDYRGAVLEFGSFDDYDSPMLVAKRVTYSNDPPVVGTLDLFVKQMTGQKGFDYDELLGPLEIVKKKLWEYERERRVISNDRKNGLLYTDIDFHPRTLSRIYLGHRVEDENKKDVALLCDQGLEHVEVYESTIDQYERKQLFRRIK